MKPTRRTASHPPNGVCGCRLVPTPDCSAVSKLLLEREGTQRDADRALQVMVILAAEEQPNNSPQPFGHLALSSDRFIATIDCTEVDGMEHRLFMAAVAGLSDEEYLACMDVSSATIGSEPR